MKRLLILLPLLFLLGCKGKEYKRIVVSLYPLKLILNDIYDSLNVEVVIEENTDPHNFSIPPRKLISLKNACLFIYTSPKMETWADELNVRKFFISKDETHAWFDPVIVKSRIDSLVSIMKMCGYNVNESKLSKFKKTLDSLHNSFKKKSGEIKRRNYILVHGSILPFFKRYNIDVYAILFRHSYDVSGKLVNRIISLDSAWIFKEKFVSNEYLKPFMKENFRMVEFDPFGYEYTKYTDFMKDIYALFR